MISKPIPYGRQCITDGDIQAVIETLTIASSDV